MRRQQKFPTKGSRREGRSTNNSFNMSSMQRSPSPPRVQPYRFYQPTERERQAMQGLFAPTSPKVPIMPSFMPDPALLNKQLDLIQNGSTALLSSPSRSPPKLHRGFGASAHVFNADGSIEMSGKDISRIDNENNRFSQKLEMLLVLNVGLVYAYSSKRTPRT